MLKERLLQIWNKYKRQMTSEELNTILGRGICYPKIDKAHRILVTGGPGTGGFRVRVRVSRNRGRRGRPLFPGFRQAFPGRVQAGSGVHGFAEFPGNGSEYRVEVLQRPERA